METAGIQQGGNNQGSANVLRSSRLKHYKARGRQLANVGFNVLTRELVLNAFSLKFDEAVYYYYNAANAYRASSKWRDAGECLVKCGEIYSRINLHIESAVFYTEAADCFYKVDKMECVKSLDLAVSIYCDTGRFDSAGRLETEIGNIYFNLLDWDEAISHYQKAADFFQGDLMFTQSYMCLEKLLTCHLEKADYQNGHDVCLQLAESCRPNNLLMFNYNKFLLKSCLCYMAMHHEHGDHHGVHKYEKIQDESEAFKYKYVLWTNSKEALFLANIIKARMAGDMDKFADHVYFWDNVRPLDKYSIAMLGQVRVEIQKEVQRRLKKKMKEEQRKQRELERKQKLMKQMRNLEQKGIDPATVSFEKKDNEEDSVSASSDEEDQAQVQEKIEDKDRVRRATHVSK